VLNDRFVRRAALAVRPYVPRVVFNGMQKVDAWVRQVNSRPARRTSMPPELRARLKREFAPDVQRLSALLKRDLAHWSK
jgi:hypothetical protein